MDNIRLVPAVVLNGNVVAERPRDFPGASSATHFAVNPCPGLPTIAQSYVGRGTAVFTKAGFNGSPLTLSGDTPPVSIAC